MLIVDLFLWKEEVVTLDGTPYYLEDGSGCVNFHGTTMAIDDINKVWNVGSYWYAADEW